MINQEKATPIYTKEYFEQLQRERDDAVKALEKYESEEFYWVYEPYKDENNMPHPGLMKKIFELRQFARETLERIRGK